MGGHVAFVMIALCAGGQAKTPGFVVVPRAVELVETPEKVGKSLSYYVPELFPATQTLAFIQSALTKAGWQPRLGKELFPGERSSLESGWETVFGERNHLVRAWWSARWVSSDGAEVQYSLSYASPLAERGLTATHVYVKAWWYDKETAAARRASASAKHTRPGSKGGP